MKLSDGPNGAQVAEHNLTEKIPASIGLERVSVRDSSHPTLQYHAYILAYMWQT